MLPLLLYRIPAGLVRRFGGIAGMPDCCCKCCNCASLCSTLYLTIRTGNTCAGLEGQQVPLVLNDTISVGCRGCNSRGKWVFDGLICGDAWKFEFTCGPIGGAEACPCLESEEQQPLMTGALTATPPGCMSSLGALNILSTPRRCRPLCLNFCGQITGWFGCQCCGNRFSGATFCFEVRDAP